MTKLRNAPSYRISPFDLQLFSAVADTGSITRGAHRMHLSLAAASTRLQKLEHAIHATLFLRTRQGVILTDAGHTLLRHAGHLQRDLEALHAEMVAHTHGVRSTVRVLCNTAAMTEYLPSQISRFLLEHPDIDIDLRELGSKDALLAMRQEQAEICIVADYVETEGLNSQFFREDRLVAMIPAKNQSGVAESLHFIDLLTRPFVGLPNDSGLSRFLQSQALFHGRALHHRVRVRSLEAVAALVGDGVGVAVIPEVAARRLAGTRITISPLADTWATRRLLLCTTKGTRMGMGAGKLFHFLAGQ